MDSKKLSEDPSTKELNQFVQTMLKQMQERFDDMSTNIVSRVDEMGKSSPIQEGESMTSRNLLGKSWTTLERKMKTPERNDCSDNPIHLFSRIS